jgi:hypothetical protein
VLVTRWEAHVARPRPHARRPRRRFETAIDPACRDVFRVGGSVPARPPAGGAELASPAPSPEPVRLVGLVRRQGRLLAAFAVDGDVVLAGPGETAGGLTVLGVGEDGVRIRRRDGSEQRLALP